MPVFRLTLLLLPALLLASRLPAASLAEQREAFRELYPRAELGIWAASGEQERRLADYILWPDLRARWMRAALGVIPDAEVGEFLDRYPQLKPARELRYQFALHLARRGRHGEFLSLYRAHYADLGVARLDCLALVAELRTGSTADSLLGRARPLWLVGHSQVDECDPLFERLRGAGLLDEALYRERFALAIEARELSLARYLARSLPESYRLAARRWSAAYGDPRRFLDDRERAADAAQYRAQLLAAVEQLAYRDPRQAAAYWNKIAREFAFADDERASIQRHVALWSARNHLDDADDLLARLPAAAVDDEVARWRVRSALRRHAWRDALQHLDALPAGERNEEQWRYWRGALLRQLGDDGAEALFASLAGERSYYGFLAADAIDAPYAFGHAELRADEAVLERLEAREDIRRARELHAVGLDSRGRSEWDAAIRRLAPGEQVQAALLAHRWGWHSRAIATAASNNHYDDLALRYPLPWPEWFEKHANAANVAPSWALGIARSESLFMPDIRSAAGAIGVMQLTPATGRRTARELRHPYTGFKTLTDPESNIRLGTWFLGRMHTRFADHPVLATAAYNAGPLRVEAWMPREQSLDARVWIETIPYAETRDYVRRVLTADAIFHWRMSGRIRRVSTHLADVPPSGAAQLAAN